MLTVYVVCLLIGGTFVAGSALLGGKDYGDHDHDLAAEADIHGDVDHDLLAGGDHHEALVHLGAESEAPHASAGDSLLLPVLSMRFWTFFLAFFGLTGTVLTGLGLWASQWLVAPAALSMGLLSGYGTSYTFGRLRRQIVNSSMREQDYLGATGRVLLPVARGQLGKVRLQLRGRTMDFVAETDDGQPLGIGREAFVYGLEQGRLKVTDPGLRQLSAPESQRPAEL